MEDKTKYFTINSDELINELVENGEIEKIGVGNRYDDEFCGLHNEYWKADNSYNWEISEENEDGINCIYSLSNDFEIRESDRLLILSKHIGTDIRGGYEDDVIYIKSEDETFYSLILGHLHLAKQD